MADKLPLLVVNDKPTIGDAPSLALAKAVHCITGHAQARGLRHFKRSALYQRTAIRRRT